MLFLTETEKSRWRTLAQLIQLSRAGPDAGTPDIRPSLRSAFHYYVGTFLASHDQPTLGRSWMQAGAEIEPHGLLSNQVLADFMGRHQDTLVMPSVVFADPAPFVHFASIPELARARENFLHHCAASLPKFRQPLRIMDLGTGDGRLVTRLLRHLLEAGRIPSVGEVLLVDASPAMCDLAGQTVRQAFPDAAVHTVNQRFQDLAAQLDRRFDVAISSMAFHHMPFEHKVDNLQKLRPWLDHFVVLEMDANHDTPQQFSAELALSIHQSYGRITDLVFAHDAPIQTAVDCVDNLLMAELVSFLLHPRGARSDYHMLRAQWHDAFRQGLGEDFTCGAECTAYSDSSLDLFTMHYGR